jgi:broad specificity phosphatase PhoE
MLDFNEFNLYLIRHGQSAVNVIPDQMGQASDVPLTEHGRHQATLLKQRLEKEGIHFLHAFSSDYTRAYDTAKIVMDPHIDTVRLYHDLREYDAGDWKGSKRSELLTPQVALRMGYMNNAFLPPGGESMNQVERRVSRWMEDNILYSPSMQKDAKITRENNFPKMNIAIFSHGMTIKCLLHYVMGFDRNFTWRIVLENTSITKLVFGEEGWRLITINDHAHLL